jgi:hypothetical protein
MGSQLERGFTRNGGDTSLANFRLSASDGLRPSPAGFGTRKRQRGVKGTRLSAATQSERVALGHRADASKAASSSGVGCIHSAGHTNEEGWIPTALIVLKHFRDGTGNDSILRGPRLRPVLGREPVFLLDRNPRQLFARRLPLLLTRLLGTMRRRKTHRRVSAEDGSEAPDSSCDASYVFMRSRT